MRKVAIKISLWVGIILFFTLLIVGISYNTMVLLILPAIALIALFIFSIGALVDDLTPDIEHWFDKRKRDKEHKRYIQSLERVHARRKEREDT